MNYYCYDFITYAAVAAFINLVCYIIMDKYKGTSGIRTVVTFFAVIAMPIISLAFENNPLIEAYAKLAKPANVEPSITLKESALASILFYPVLYIANLVIFKESIDDWREDTLNDIIEKLNGSDPYFMRARIEILKKCGNNTLDWGIKNLSTRKYLKLAFKSFILDLKTARKTVAYKISLRREQRKLINAEKADLKRKKRFLDTAEI